MNIRFEWDAEKNRLNIRKHGISFEQAARIFDGFTVSRVDDRYEYGEAREITLGLLSGVAVLVVIHTDRDGTCRIISARQANRNERKLYDKEIRKAFGA